MVSQVANTHFRHIQSVSRVIHRVNDVGDVRASGARYRLHDASSSHASRGR